MQPINIPSQRRTVPSAIAPALHHSATCRFDDILPAVWDVRRQWRCYPCILADKLSFGATVAGGVRGPPIGPPAVRGMRNLPVHWSEGMFLRPHHFQAADRHWRELLATSTLLGKPLQLRNLPLRRCRPRPLRTTRSK